MTRTFRQVVLGAVVIAAVGCGPGARSGGGDDVGGGDDGPGTCPVCSDDKSAVVDCDGNAVACPLDQQCNAGMCMNACEAAEKNHSSVGCDYYAVDMDAAQGPPMDACFTVFVANTSPAQVHIDVEWNGLALNLAQFAKLPVGAGQNITYAPFDPVAGLAPGKVAILFLAYAPGGGGPLMPNVNCPVPAAIGTDAQISGNGFGKAFHITTDLPVVAYQMLPFGGGRAAATGASLLLPTSAWGTQYVAVSAYDPPAGSQPPIQVAQGPSYNIVAKEDGTNVTIRPNQAIIGGGGLMSGTANAPYSVTLDKGQYAQITQLNGLSGSPVTSDKPIGMFGGHQIMSIDRCCGDHGEQMLAPVRALGYEYVAAPHADRRAPGEARIYRLFGAVNETHLVYDPPGIGPPVLNAGAFHEIRSATPFTVRSQGSTHPFSMFTYMSGAGDQGEGGQGDADFVRLVPPEQFLKHYVFFTDPTYPFTTLTVVRKANNGAFEDVTLDCMGGPITGWTPVGTDGQYEITFVKTVDHFTGMNGCNNGVQVMNSQGGFGVWVWGWGSEDTSTGWVSYGYPAGEGVLPINDVVIFKEEPLPPPAIFTPADEVGDVWIDELSPRATWWTNAPDLLRD
ncbi:MAG: hypothetical protein JWP01_2491 [Myxococcales bacterium]|nr:hypothetical protein [Myxococcales bacterium]